MLSLIRTRYIRRLPLDEGHGRISSPRSFMWMYLNIDGLDAGLANFWVVRIKMFLFFFPFCSTRARIVYTVGECTFEYTRSTQIFVLKRQNPMPLNVPVFSFYQSQAILCLKGRQCYPLACKSFVVPYWFYSRGGLPLRRVYVTPWYNL